MKQKTEDAYNPQRQGITQPWNQIKSNKRLRTLNQRYLNPNLDYGETDPCKD